MPGTTEQLLYACHGFGTKDQSPGLHSRSDNYRPVDSLTVTTQIIPRNKGTHTVSQNNIGHLRIAFLCDLLQPMYIPYHYRCRILFAEVTVSAAFRHRFSMSEMVFSGNKDSSGSQKFSQVLITLHILCHSVHYLHNAFYIAVIGSISHCMDTAFAVPGIKVKFFLNHKTSLVTEKS